jgi:putative phosphoesterase
VRIGLLSDIYGNLPALEAAWTWVCGEGPEAVVCLGDLVGYGPFPSEVVGFVRSHGIETVQGNWDRAAGRGRSDPGDEFTDPTWRKLARESLAWTVSALGSDDARFLRELPTELRFRAERSDLLCVHGLPGNVSGRLGTEAAGDVLDSLLRRNGCSVLASGNTGRPAVAVRPGGCMVNPGSVGGGTYPSAASAAVIEAGGRGGVPVWWQRIEYDFEGYERAYLGAGLPGIFLRCFRTGRAPTGEWMTDDTRWRQRWAEP